MTPDLPDSSDSGDADTRVGVVEAEVEGGLDMREQDGEAADGGDGGAADRGVGIAHVLIEDVDDEQSDVRLLGGRLDHQVTHRSLQRS